MMEGIAPPWGDRPSIYSHVWRQIPADDEARLPAGRLPDDEQIPTNQRNWAPGAVDGVLLTHSVLEEDTAGAEAAAKAVHALISDPNDQNARVLYDLLKERRAIRVAVPLLRMLAEAPDVTPYHLYRIGHWLVVGAADREAVKIGLALWAVSATEREQEVIKQLGLHEEFTLFAVRALKLRFNDANAIWEIARRTRAWGRQHAADQLWDAPDPHIQQWLAEADFEYL